MIVSINLFSLWISFNLQCGHYGGLQNLIWWNRKKTHCRNYHRRFLKYKSFIIYFDLPFYLVTIGNSNFDYGKFWILQSLWTPHILTIVSNYIKAFVYFYESGNIPIILMILGQASHPSFFFFSPKIKNKIPWKLLNTVNFLWSSIWQV